MKKRKQIKVNGVKYWLHMYPTKSRSNYNHMICVNEVGDKSPICGITVKETDRLEDFEDWAKREVLRYINNETPLPF